MANTTHSPTRSTDTIGHRPQTPRPRRGGRRGRRGLRSRIAGGINGNERLTVLSGILLFVLFAGLGITILRIGQLLWLHLFLGLMLIGPVVLKLLSTGYRFTLYYLGDRTYRRKGPPAPALRMLAPLLVLSTLGVFATGVALLVLGPASRQPLVLLHKASFIVWVALCAIHVLAHIPDVLRSSSGARRARRETLSLAVADRATRELTLAGGGMRAVALVASVALGLVLATSLTGLFHLWTG